MRAWTAVVLALLAASCDVSGALQTLEDLEPIVEVESLRTSVAGVILDARTGEPVSAPVTLSFAGEGAETTRDLLSRPIETMRTDDGAVSFGIANTVRPSAARPFDLRVIASAPGYRTNAVRLAIRKEGLQEFRLFLDRIDAPLPPSAGTEALLPLAGEVVSDTVRLSDSATGGRLLEVVVPSGIRIARPQGPRIAASVSLPSPELFAVFPGGIDAGLIPGSEPASFTAGALVRVEVPGDTPFLGDSVRVRTALAPWLLSPATNEAIRPGDRVDLHRWRAESGRWKTEQRLEVSGTQAEPTAEFWIREPGVFAVGFWNLACTEARVRPEGNRVGGSVKVFRGSSSQADGARVWRFGPGESEVVLYDPPGFWRGEIEIRHGETTVRLGYDSLCGADLDVRVDGGAPPSVAERNVRLAPCRALRVTDLPTLAVFARPFSAVPSPAPESERLPPFLSSGAEFSRDPLGRIIGGKVRSAVPAGDMATTLVLGAEAWTSSGATGPIDLAPLARGTGICVDP